MATYTGDKKYIGKERIVIAMDIGTTHSAVSFAYLYPDDYPRVRMVNKWPGQADSAGSSKIPTLVAYRDAECKACGSEAIDYVDDSQYEVAKWFKLQLHPSSMKIPDLPPRYGSSASFSGFETPALPGQVSIEQVYTDFMKYLMENTQTSFEQGLPGGTAVWERLRDNMIIVLTTPNGWELAQQNILRQAAIAAGLVTKEKAHELLDFVTEGEASVHYVLAYSQSKSWLFPSSMFAVIDAGGSTVDSTLYECKSTAPGVILEEVCPSECIQAGGVFVDRAGEAMLRLRLRRSKFGDDESIRDMMNAFESRTKRIFDGNKPSNVVDFGGSRDNDREHGIIKGKLSLTKQEMEISFHGVIARIVASCLKLLNGRKVKYLLLVGGFGESRYLQMRLGELFERHGASVVTVEEPSKKAAAEGAVVWYIKQTVLARISRNTIGTAVVYKFDRLNPEHQQRMSRVYLDHAGQKEIRGGFDILVPKGQRMSRDFTCTKYYSQKMLCQVANTTGLDSFECELRVWEGGGLPTWSIDVHGNPLPELRSLCTLNADLSMLHGSLKAKGPARTRYYEVHFAVAVRFGGTQLKASIQWEEGGTLFEGPVSIIPNAII